MLKVYPLLIKDFNNIAQMIFCNFKCQLLFSDFFKTF